MKKITIAGGLCLSLLSSVALSQDHPDVSPRGGVASPLDRGYAGLTSAANSYEVSSSRMALHKSRDRKVRSLALTTLDEYASAEHRLREAATYQDYQGAAEIAATPETATSLDQLGALEGSDFDKAYVSSQVAFHAAEIQKETDYSIQGSYGPLLQYEASMLPRSRMAMRRVLTIQDAMAR